MLSLLLSLILSAPSVCLGDTNGDNVVNILDASTIAAHYGQFVEPNTSGDINGDGVVNILDLVGVFSNYGKVCLVAPNVAHD